MDFKYLCFRIRIRPEIRSRILKSQIIGVNTSNNDTCSCYNLVSRVSNRVLRVLVRMLYVQEVLAVSCTIQYESRLLGHIWHIFTDPYYFALHITTAKKNMLKIINISSTHWILLKRKSNHSTLDGDSEIGAHIRSKLCSLICLRHLVRSSAVKDRCLFPKKTYFPSCLRNMFLVKI